MRLHARFASSISMNFHCYAIFVSHYRLMSQVNLAFPTSGGDTEVGFVKNEAVFENFHQI